MNLFYEENSGLLQSIPLFFNFLFFLDLESTIAFYEALKEHKKCSNMLSKDYIQNTREWVFKKRDIDDHTVYMFHNLSTDFH